MPVGAVHSILLRLYCLASMLIDELLHHSWTDFFSKYLSNRTFTHAVDYYKQVYFLQLWHYQVYIVPLT